MKGKRKQLSFPVEGPKRKRSSSRPARSSSRPASSPRARARLSFAQLEALRALTVSPLNEQGQSRHVDWHARTFATLRDRGLIAWDERAAIYTATRAGRLELERHDKRCELAGRVQLALPLSRCA